MCGYGRVGGIIGEALARHGFPYVVIEQDQRRVERLQERGIPALWGDASNRTVLEHASLGDAQLLVVATDDRLANRQIVEHARHTNPKLEIVVRTHSWNELDHMHRLGVDEAVMGEVELALEMSRHALRAFGAEDTGLAETVRRARDRAETERPETLLDVTK